MKKNNTEVVHTNEDGSKIYQYDNALQRGKSTLKYFMTQAAERIEA